METHKDTWGRPWLPVLCPTRSPPGRLQDEVTAPAARTTRTWPWPLCSASPGPVLPWDAERVLSRGLEARSGGRAQGEAATLLPLLPGGPSVPRLGGV